MTRPFVRYVYCPLWLAVFLGAVFLGAAGLGFLVPLLADAFWMAMK